MHDVLNDPEVRAVLEEFHKQWEENPWVSREEGERLALAAGREGWERKQAQRKMEQRAARLLTKYQPRRSTKHPRGATKASVASRKAKNRAKRKAR